MEAIKYTNTSEHLYDDIALWEKTEGKSFFEEMPLNGNKSSLILDRIWIRSIRGVCDAFASSSHQNNEGSMRSMEPSLFRIHLIEMDYVPT